MKMIRTIINSIVEGVIKRFSGSGRAGETFTNREYMQHYGFTSRPLSGAEGILFMEGNRIYLIASDDRRYRIAVENGEVCLYTDEGDFIHFKRGNLLHISTGDKLLIDATNDVEVNAPTAILNAAAKCQVNSPEINLSGDRSGLYRLIDERFRTLFNAHVHSGCGGSENSGAPTTTMELANHTTDKVRGA